MILDLLPRPRNELSWEGRRKVSALRSHGSTQAQRMTTKRKYTLADSESQWKFRMKVKQENSCSLQPTDANVVHAARHEARGGLTRQGCKAARLQMASQLISATMKCNRAIPSCQKIRQIRTFLHHKGLNGPQPGNWQLHQMSSV